MLYFLFFGIPTYCIIVGQRERSLWYLTILFPHWQDISVKTKEILANLVALADSCEDSKITLEGLKQRHFPPATENFLFHLAAAEQLLRV